VSKAWDSLQRGERDSIGGSEGWNSLQRGSEG
jgi:hypothetical protein